MSSRCSTRAAIRSRLPAIAGSGAPPDTGARPQMRMSAEREAANLPLAELREQKVLRAVYSERQLQEVLTDFWFNHFNVDARKGRDRFLLTEYERDVDPRRTCSASSAICSARPRRARRCCSISTTG